MAAAPESFAADRAVETASQSQLWLGVGLLLTVIAALALYSMFRKRKRHCLIFE